MLLMGAVAVLAYQLVFKVFFPVKTPGQQPETAVVLRMEDETLRLGANPTIVIENNTQQILVPPDRCPEPSVDVYRVREDGSLQNITSGETILPCEKPEAVGPGKRGKISLAPWKKSLFSQAGTFEVELAAGTGSSVARFTIAEPGVFTKMFRAFITKPLLNGLVAIAAVLPGHSLGLAIILLTLLVKLLLFLPTQHALEGQKKMQLLQPKLEEIRRQFKDDPAAMQRETMRLWKAEKVNPFQSCLPLLVQFPVLIGLFYVVRDGVHLELSEHLLYAFSKDLNWTFGTVFLGLDLTKPYIWLFPPLLVVLQFLQMKLTFHIADRKKAQEIAKKTTPQADTPQEIQQRMMLYVLPLMIGFFAITMPTAVSLYWGVSTLFAVGQQLIVNREHIRVRGST